MALSSRLSASPLSPLANVRAVAGSRLFQERTVEMRVNATRTIEDVRGIYGERFAQPSMHASCTFCLYLKI
jgi:hypothetical protein